MQHREIPVVLVVAGKKVNYIPHVVKNLSAHSGFKLFYVICPKKDLDKARSLSSAIDEASVVVVDEESVIPSLNLAKVKEFLNPTLPNWPEYHLAGWYLQQFLKMGFSKYAPNHEYYLIWDSDTLLTRSISFFDGDKILLTRGNEFHKEYFDTIKHLFSEIDLQSVSHISQHLMVRTADMIELINSLEKSDHKWWQKILSELNGKTPFQFSEYETYTNYCLSSKSDSYVSIKRNWFRYGKSFYGCNLTEADMTKLSKLYDFVAFEDWDYGVTRRIRSQIIVRLHMLVLFVKKLNFAK
jgi:hypothetical protein